MSFTGHEETIRVFKLSNGENIIGGYDGPEIFDFNVPLMVSLPLKMTVVHHSANKAESLNLSPWVHPMSEKEYIDINPANVVMSAEASVGLTSYYNHCISRFEWAPDMVEEAVNLPKTEDEGPTDEEMDLIEVEEALDELTDPLLKFTIH